MPVELRQAPLFRTGITTRYSYCASQEQDLYVEGFHQAAFEARLPIRLDQQSPSDTLAVTMHAARRTALFGHY